MYIFFESFFLPFNSKKGAHNSVSKISNKKLYDLAVKYNNHFLTNETISNINHSNTNENL